MTADRVRVGYRTGRVQVQDLVCVLETKSVTGKSLEMASVRELVGWSGLLGNNSAQTLEVDSPFSSSNHKYLLLLSDFLKDEQKTNDSESSDGRLDRPDRGYVQKSTASWQLCSA